MMRPFSFNQHLSHCIHFCNEFFVVEIIYIDSTQTAGFGSGK